MVGKFNDFDLFLEIYPMGKGIARLYKENEDCGQFREATTDCGIVSIFGIPDGEYRLEINQEGCEPCSCYFTVRAWGVFPMSPQLSLKNYYDNVVELKVELEPEKEDDNMYVGDGKKCNDCGKVKGHDCECDKTPVASDIKRDIENYWKVWKSYEKAFEEHQEAVRKLNEELKDKSEKLKKERSYFIEQIEKYFSSKRTIMDITLYNNGEISFEYAFPEPVPSSGLVTPIPVSLQLQIIQITNEFSFDVEGDKVTVTLYHVLGNVYDE